MSFDAGLLNKEQINQIEAELRTWRDRYLEAADEINRLRGIVDKCAKCSRGDEEGRGL